MTPSQFAQGLIDFLRNQVNSSICLGKWKRIKGGGSLTDYKADFDNNGTTFQIWIWLNDGGFRNGIAAHNPPHWFIRITDLKSKRQIHNMDLDNGSNHQNVSPNVSILLESGNKLGISTLTGKQIEYIDNTVVDWQKKAIEDIFNYELQRLAYKKSTSAITKQFRQKGLRKQL